MKIVLSYRRSDAPGAAGRIFDKLRSKFGKANVFMDVDSIPLGVDFRRHIQKELDGCDVLLAIIGPRWLGGGEGLRIKDETDWVRIEIETALQRDIPVVPVLVEGAAMPQPDQLPETLRDLAFRNAAEVDSGRDFHTHIARVARVIRSLDRRLKEMAEQARQKAEAERLEQERLAREQEEACRREEQERILREMEEASQKAEQERLGRGQEEARRKERDRLAREQEEVRRKAEQTEKERLAREEKESQETKTRKDETPASVTLPERDDSSSRNKRRLRWAVASFGFLALGIGGNVYYVEQRDAARQEQLRMAQEAVRQRDFDRAIANYNQVIRLNPKDAEAYFRRGAAYWHKGDFDRAIADLNEAIRLDPQDTNAYSNRASAYQDKGDLDRAIADYDQAIRLNPKDADAYSNRGVAYESKGNLDRAITDYEAALAIDPKHSSALAGRARVRDALTSK